MGSGRVPRLDSEAVVRVTVWGGRRSTTKSIFYPGTGERSTAPTTNLGATSPVVIDVPGATPSSYVVAVEKAAHVLPRHQEPGRDGGQAAELMVASATRSVRTAWNYRTAMAFT